MGKVPFTRTEVYLMHSIVLGFDRLARTASLDRHNLSYSEFLVAMEAESGRPSQGEVARALDLSQSSVSQKVANLRRKGLLEQHRDDESRRIVRLSLTETGRATLQEVYADLTRAASDVFDTLGDGRPAFRRALLAVQRALLSSAPETD